MPLKAELFLDPYIKWESAFEPHSKLELPESCNAVVWVCSTHYSGKNTHLNTHDTLNVKTKANADINRARDSTVKPAFTVTDKVSYSKKVCL